MNKKSTIDWKKLINKKVIANFYDLSINTKSIILLFGVSSAGKTSCSLHFANNSIENNFRVLYIDTENKSIIERPEPNLFLTFYNQAKAKYDKNFIYSNQLEEKEFFKIADDIKPNLIIIDSIYTAFLNKYKDNNAKLRAKKIRSFLSDLRSYIMEKEIAVVLTSPVGKICNAGQNKIVVMGGDGIKYLSDVKVSISFFEDHDCDDKPTDLRLFTVDRQIQYVFKINNGGQFEKINQNKKAEKFLKDLEAGLKK